MPNLLTRLARAAFAVPETKAAPLAGPVFALYGDGRAVWTERDGAALARAGFERNAVVHRAVRLVAEAAAAIPLSVTGPEPAGGHPLAALVARPNPREGGARLLEGVYGHLMVSGNAALWSKCTRASGKLRCHLRRDELGPCPEPDSFVKLAALFDSSLCAPDGLCAATMKVATALH